MSIYVATISHKYGVNLYMAKSEELLNAEIFDFVQENWGEVSKIKLEGPLLHSVVIEQYFDVHHTDFLTRFPPEPETNIAGNDTLEVFKKLHLIGRADQVVEYAIQFEDIYRDDFEHALAWKSDDDIDPWAGHWEQYEANGAGTYDCFGHYLENEHSDLYTEGELKTDNRYPGHWQQVSWEMMKWLRQEEYRQLVVEIGSLYFWAVQWTGASIDQDESLIAIYENWKRGTL